LLNHRIVLVLVVALGLAAGESGRVGAQTRAAAQPRVAISQTVGFILEPGGTLRVWGMDPGASVETPEPAHNRMGLGHNNPVKMFTLYPVPGVKDVVAISATSTNAYAVLTDGRILAWGGHSNGALGHMTLAQFETAGEARGATPTPTPVAVRFDAVDVSAKDLHVLALARDGSVWAWGRGDSGELGIGPLPTVNFRGSYPSVETFVPYPVRIPNLENVVAISAGNRHSLALLKDGTVRAWGQNRYGQVGDGTSTNRDTPTTVPGVRNIAAIAAGAYRSVAVLADGTVMEWGADHVNLTPRLTPALLPGARGIKSVVAGNEHVAAITGTGQIMTWGLDSHYQTGRGPGASAPGLVRGITGVSSVAAGGESTIAVLGSGQMMTWGHVPSGYGRFPIPLELDGLVAAPAAVR
jgi:alpha-tubulin suppressor-like RCC1 family protein